MLDKLTQGQQAYRRGWVAENIAAWYLRFKGYKVLVRRYKTKVGEVDIIAARGGVLTAVEVKARKDADTGLLSVSGEQQQRVMRAMSHYMQRHKAYQDFDVRFDVIVVSRRRLPRHLMSAWR